MQAASGFGRLGASYWRLRDHLLRRRLGSFPMADAVLRPLPHRTGSTGSSSSTCRARRRGLVSRPGVEPGARVHIEFGCAVRLHVPSTTRPTRSHRHRRRARRRRRAPGRSAPNACWSATWRCSTSNPSSGASASTRILFADVLEHLRDPAALLSRFRPLVAERRRRGRLDPECRARGRSLALLAGRSGIARRGCSTNRTSASSRAKASGPVRELWLPDHPVGYGVGSTSRRRSLSRASVPEAARAWATGTPGDDVPVRRLRGPVRDGCAVLCLAYRARRGAAGAREAAARSPRRPRSLRAELEELRPLRGAARGARGPPARARESSSGGSSPSGPPSRRDRRRRGRRLRLALLAPTPRRCAGDRR